ncbi:MAG: alpha-ketoglutarate-dependent dioxygenase AlkB family protein [Gammaproteobacteria bacterium]
MPADIHSANLVPFDGEVHLIRRFYRSPEADALYSILESTLAWREESVFIFGKRCKVPRLTCWYGDPGACYRYSGVDHQPMPWTLELKAVKEKIEDRCECSFNSVLANLYRDGRDSMGYHADDEKELGQNPVIASLSLGEQRVFKLRHKKMKRERLDIELGHGDLLVMAGTLQHHWVHALPKSTGAQGSRINLTFRKIEPAE